MGRIATYHVKHKGESKFGIRSFDTLDTYKAWQRDLAKRNMKLINIYWRDGYPGLDRCAFERK